MGGQIERPRVPQAAAAANIQIKGSGLTLGLFPTDSGFSSFCFIEVSGIFNQYPLQKQDQKKALLFFSLFFFFEAVVNYLHRAKVYMLSICRRR